MHDRMKPLLAASFQLSARPESSPLYGLRLYPLSLEDALLYSHNVLAKNGVALKT